MGELVNDVLGITLLQRVRLVVKLCVVHFFTLALEKRIFNDSTLMNNIKNLLVIGVFRRLQQFLFELASAPS